MSRQLDFKTNTQFDLLLLYYLFYVLKETNNPNNRHNRENLNIELHIIAENT